MANSMNAYNPIHASGITSQRLLILMLVAAVGCVESVDVDTEQRATLCGVFGTPDCGVQQAAYVKASNAGWLDEFGHQIAIDGHVMVVGAPYERGNGEDKADDSLSESGAAYVFVDPNGDGDWSDAVEHAYLKAHNLQANDHFGRSVAISGHTIVVGADGERSDGSSANDNSAPGAGAAYVFVDPNQDGNWKDAQQHAYLKASNAESVDLFGARVAIDGNAIAVSAWGEDSNGAGPADNSAGSAGAVYVFVDPNHDGVWTDAIEHSYLKAPVADANDLFGLSVAISGNAIVVGAGNEDSDGSSANDNSISNAGAAYVFADPNGDGDWTDVTYQAYLKADNPQPAMVWQGNFGADVAINGSTIAVSAQSESLTNPAVMNAGAVYMFIDPNQDGNWTDVAKHVRLTASNPDVHDRFGSQVALDGDLLVVGALGEDGYSLHPHSNARTQSGAAYLFVDPNQDGDWSDASQTAYIKASNADIGDQFGTGVALSGDAIAVSAPFERSDGSSPQNNSLSLCGAAYVFKAP